jgi:hypothetical protein
MKITYEFPGCEGDVIDLRGATPEIDSSINTLKALGLGLGLHRRSAEHFIPAVENCDLQAVAFDHRPWLQGTFDEYNDWPQYVIQRIERGEVGLVAQLGPTYAWYLAGWCSEQTEDDVEQLLQGAISAGRELLADPRKLGAYMLQVERDLVIARRATLSNRGVPQHLWPQIPCVA